jgi:gluconokinase
LPDNSEGAAYGAAVLGFISQGKMQSIADTASLVKAKKLYAPIEENVATYEQLFGIFARLYNKLQDEFAEITAYQKKI